MPIHTQSPLPRRVIWLVLALIAALLLSSVAAAQDDVEDVVPADPPDEVGEESAPPVPEDETEDTEPTDIVTDDADPETEAAQDQGEDEDEDEGDIDPAFDALLDDTDTDGVSDEVVDEALDDSDLDAPEDDDDDDFFDDDLLRILNFAGSAQLDYLLVPTDTSARNLSLDGFTTELSLKLAADVTTDISVEVKTCFGCHGFELGTAHVDYRPFSGLRVRAGKFVPNFGDFPLRHDPANHLTSDKPLPYDMGRMLRLREWNMSVLPAPYVDNGLEINLGHSIGDHVELDYAAFVLGGLRGSNDAVDVDFIQSRSAELYYVDNNSEPAVGGRVAASILFNRDVSLRMGGSGMWGHYDPEGELDYLVVGGDMVLRLWQFTLRAEYLLRRTRMGLGENPQERFQYGPGSDGEYDPYNLKDGFYAELDFPIWGGLEFVSRVDGLRRMGNVLIGSALRSESLIVRYTAGLNYVFAERTFRIKASGEFYDFSDFSDEAAIHLGLVGAF